MSWQEDLQKKANELNLRKEETNGPIISSTHISNRNSSWRNGSVRLSESNREINKDERRNKLMIPSKGLFTDYDAIDKENISAAEKVWKYIPKLIKVILNCRTNTVKIMDKLGIPRDEEKKQIPEKTVEK
jgi:hypothetical protein